VREICHEKEYHTDFINGTDDHVHLLLSLNPKFAVSETVKNIKGLTWQWVNEEKRTEEYFEWQDGYAVISVSPFNVHKVRNYIRNQEKHHLHTSYEQETDWLKNTVHLQTISTP
jgi:REP element-mobilizing transposase RayT